MTPQGPLARRIAARKGIVAPEPVEPKPEPKPVRRPEWLDRLKARDETGRLS